MEEREVKVMQRDGGKRSRYKEGTERKTDEMCWRGKSCEEKRREGKMSDEKNMRRERQFYKVRDRGN